VAVCLERNKGPLVYAVRTYAFRVLFPVNPATLAKDREALTPSHAKDDPTDAALQLDLLLTHRDKRQPLIPQRAALRALEQRVEHRRRLVGDNGRLPNRRTSTLKHDFPHVLRWFEDQDTTRCCDVLAQWPPLKAAQLARHTPLERSFRAHHGRYTNGIATPIQALKNAIPLPTDEGGIAPQALLVQALVAQLRGLLHAIADFAQAIAPRAQRPPAFPVFAALLGAGAVLAPRLLVAFGEQRERYAYADELHQ
jgi:transposase